MANPFFAAYAKAEALSFDDASFDLVTCRIAPHHFDSIPAFVAEAHRVLKAGGLFGLVDNVVVAGDVGDFVNAFERFRDPSHLRAWTMQEWRDALAAQGFSIAHEEELDKTMEFKPWAARHDATMQAFLRAMLAHADPAAKASLDPQGTGDALTSACAKACSSRARAEVGFGRRSRTAPTGTCLLYTSPSPRD